MRFVWQKKKIILTCINGCAKDFFNKQGLRQNQSAFSFLNKNTLITVQKNKKLQVLFHIGDAQDQIASLIFLKLEGYTLILVSKTEN